MSDQNDQDGVEIESLAKNRSRRTRKDKTAKFAALQKYKEAKGSGGKYDVIQDEEDVYEEVDESAYSKIVQSRQEDDWIVDDDGCGYVEDGREIFDEDEDMPAESKGGKGSSKSKGGKKKQNPNIRADGSKPKNIKSMFAAQAVNVKPKKKEREINLADDDALGDIMSELRQNPTSAIMPPPIKLKPKSTTPKSNPFATKPAPKRVMKPIIPPNLNKEPEPAVKDEVKVKEPEVESPKAPKQKKPVPKQIKTALDGLDSMDIEQFDSPEVDSGRDTQPDIVEDSMDVSGIDFDDDFGDSENKSPKKPKVEAKKSMPQLDSGSSGWETIKSDSAPDIPMDIVVDSSKLPVVTNDDGDQVLRMYWIDAFEDQYKQPGVVYLFGKVWIESAKSYVSCCVCVKNIERRVFVLPRATRMNMKTAVSTGEEVTFIDVYQEFDRVADKFKIMKFKSMKVTKEYAFEITDVPAESDYLEVRYSADYPALPSDLQGENFSHVFGSKTSSLENLLIHRKMKGPAWIDIKMPQLPSPPVSWCKVEAFVNNPEYITVLPQQSAPPPLVVMTMNLRTIPNPKTHQNEVIAVACLIQHKYHTDKPAPKPHFQQHFCAVSKPSDCVFPFDLRDKLKQNGSMKVEIMGTERALLGFLLAKIHKIDPDVIVGHDIYGFDIDVLLHRIQHNKIPHWSKMGRLKRSTMPKLGSALGAKNSAAATAASGRLITDIQISAKELIRCRSYDLTELVSQILKEKRSDIDQDQLKTYFSSSAFLIQFLERTLMDSNFILRIMYELMVLPLALQITNICGNILARTLMGGRSERNEYLLLHAFTEKNFIVPDKTWGKKQVAQTDDQTEEGDGDANTTTKKSGRRKPAYAGGLVLEPKKGFYDKFILLLDFNSLYPSIIQEYNICFTTINRTSNNTSQDDDEMNLELPDADLDPGVLPTEIRKLVQSRRTVKQLMKQPDLTQDQYMQYDIRQKALKLTANSMYGCLGFTYSRFYAKPLAALVTGKGREILLKTKELVQNMNLDVIYGDTDSIMVNTNCTDIDQVFKLGNKVKAEVNKLYRLLEIDIDGVFKSMLLLKKKKYAALTVTKVGDQYVTAQELKGLDIVRRDWCTLAKEAGNYVVSQILSGDNRESIVENIHTKLIEIGEKVKDNSIPDDMYHITKQLTKDPEHYPDKKSLSHVQVALRINSKGGRKLKQGDTVYYVICKDGSNLAATQRAYHPDELLKNENLKIDADYYLAHQVHPVVSRLCDPIDGTDAAHIAQCLGLDPSGYRQSMRSQAEADEEDALLGGDGITDEERYQDCDRLIITCKVCGKQIILDGAFKGAGSAIEVTLAKCPNPECTASPADMTPVIMNKLTTAMRSHIKQYYEGWMKCEDTACGSRLKKLPLTFYRGHPICQICNRGTLIAEYSDVKLYHQLCFYRHIFDLEKALQTIKDPLERDVAQKFSRVYQQIYKDLKLHVDKKIQQSAYSEVNLTTLFHGLFSLHA